MKWLQGLFIQTLVLRNYRVHTKIAKVVVSPSDSLNKDTA